MTDGNGFFDREEINRSKRFVTVDNVRDTVIAMVRMVEEYFVRKVLSMGGLDRRVKRTISEDGLSWTTGSMIVQRIVGLSKNELLN